MNQRLNVTHQMDAASFMLKHFSGGLVSGGVVNADQDNLYSRSKGATFDRVSLPVPSLISKVSSKEQC